MKYQDLTPEQQLRCQKIKYALTVIMSRCADVSQLRRPFIDLPFIDDITSIPIKDLTTEIKQLLSKTETKNLAIAIKRNIAELQNIKGEK